MTVEVTTIFAVSVVRDGTKLVASVVSMVADTTLVCVIVTGIVFVWVAVIVTIGVVRTVEVLVATI